jgi:hypothetical protein
MVGLLPHLNRFRPFLESAVIERFTFSGGRRPVAVNLNCKNPGVPVLPDCLLSNQMRSLLILRNPRIIA